MNNITDHAFVPTMDAQVTEHFEDTDTLADADGVEARNSRGAHAKDKEQTPEFVLAEFKWTPRTDKITGETRWFTDRIALCGASSRVMGTPRRQECRPPSFH